MPKTDIQIGYKSAQENLQSWANANATVLIEKVDQFRELALTDAAGGLAFGIAQYLWECALEKMLLPRKEAQHA